MNYLAQPDTTYLVSMLVFMKNKNDIITSDEDIIGFPLYPVKYRTDFWKFISLNYKEYYDLRLWFISNGLHHDFNQDAKYEQLVEDRQAQLIGRGIAYVKAAWISEWMHK